MKDLLLTYLHLLAVIVAVGGNIFLLWVLSPAARKTFSEEDYQKLIARVIRRFHPLELLCYGTILMTGAWILTQYKIAAGVTYFQEYGRLLLEKFTLVFIVFMIAAGKFFGVGTGIVAILEEGGDRSMLPRKFRTLRLLSTVNLLFLFLTIFLGLQLSHS